jgi:two-component system chemotaxis response regulator CheB
MQVVKALVVDDSAIYRMLVNNALSAIPGVTVVARSRDGKEAIEAIRAKQPDFVILDVEMPVMDGLQALREIGRLAQTESVFKNVKVVMLSTLTKEGTDTTIQCLNEGAIECIPKPMENDVEKNQEILTNQLKQTVDLVRMQMQCHPIAGAQRVEPLPRLAVENLTSKPSLKGMRQKSQVVLIGVSTGGPAALSAMLPELSKKLNLPILIIQHMPPGFTKSLAESLAKKCRHKVVEATHGELVMDDTIYVAPGGKHMIVVNSGMSKKINLNEAPTENGCRPSVDVLFRSAAMAYGGKLTAVILTGMGSDGTLGAKPLHEMGAYVIAQDKESSVVWGMPGSAVEAGVVDEVVSLDGVPSAVLNAVG